MNSAGASESACLDEKTGLVVENEALQMKEMMQLNETEPSEEVANGRMSLDGSTLSEHSPDCNGPETEQTSQQTPGAINGDSEGLNGNSTNGEHEESPDEQKKEDGAEELVADTDCCIVEQTEEAGVKDDGVGGVDEEEEDMDTDVVIVGDSESRSNSVEDGDGRETKAKITIVEIQQTKEAVIELEKSKSTSNDGGDAGGGGGGNRVDITADKDDDVVVVREEPKTTVATPNPSVATKPPGTTPTKPVSQSENMRPVGKMLYDLGLDLARQQVYKDLIKIQNKKSAHSKLGEKEERQLSKLKLAYDNILSKNEPYQMDLMTCHKCDFTTESLNALELHKEHAHAKKDNLSLFECSFCDAVYPSPHAFYAHMDMVHGRRGRIQPAKSTYDCHYCNFETQVKRAYVNHNARCVAKFDLKKNLAPAPSDYDIPLENKKAAPNVPQLAPSLGRPPIVTNPQARPGFPPQQLSANTRGVTPLPVSGTGQQLFQLGHTLYTLVHSQGQAFLTPLLPGAAPVANPAIARPGAPRAGAPQPPVSAATAAPRMKPPQPSTINTVRSILEKHKVKMPNVAPLKPVHKPAVPVLQSNSSSGSKTFEVCEICGGTARDRESLRIHIFYAHKVEITPEIFNQKSGPLLSCELCLQKFWTYQGVMRHTQTQHGFKANNVGAGSMCCICGEHNLPMGMLAHLVARHNVSIRRFLEMNKCFLCKTSFPVHFLLKMHMLKNHSSIITSSEVFASFLKSLGLSKAFMPVASTEASPSNHLNSSTKIDIGGKKGKGTEVRMLADISPRDHPHKCSRCSMRFPYEEMVQKHYADVHHNEKDPCSVCGCQITIGRPMVRHMKMEHLTKCSVVVRRLPRKDYFFYMAKKRKRMEAEVKSRNESKTSVEDTSEADSSVAETPVKRIRLNSGENEVRRENGSDKENSEDTGDMTGEKLEMNGEDPIERKPGKKTEVIDVDGEQIIIEEQGEDD